jgi:hypothetical protein
MQYALALLLSLPSGYGVVWQMSLQRAQVSVGYEVPNLDTDADSLPDIVASYGYSRCESVAFFNGITHQLLWTIPNPYPSYSSWSYSGTANTDADGTPELVLWGGAYASVPYPSRFRIYDCVSHLLEFESPEFASGSYISVPVLRDIDGNGRSEICLGYGDTLDYTWVAYGWTGPGVNDAGLTGPIFRAVRPSPAARIVTIPTPPGRLVTIYDAAGRIVTTLPQVPSSAPVLWDCRDQVGVPVPPGAYFYSCGDLTGKIEIIR